MNPQFCSPLHVPLRPSFVPVVMRPSLPVWYTSTQDQSSPVHGVPLFPFGLTPETNFNSPTTIIVSHSKGNENLCSSPTCKWQIAAVNTVFETTCKFGNTHYLGEWLSKSTNQVYFSLATKDTMYLPNHMFFSVSCNHECLAYHFVLSFLSFLSY